MRNRTFIATVLALSVAVTGITTSSARADADDVAKIIAGVAAVAIIGAAIADNKKRKRRHEASRNSHSVQHDNYGFEHWGTFDQGGLHRQRRHGEHEYYDDSHGGHIYRDSHKKRHKQRHARRKQLPRHCLRDFESRRHGWFPGFGRGCLRKNYSHFHQLPHSCERRGFRRGKQRTVFSARCLRQHGYTMARNY